MRDRRSIVEFIVDGDVAPGALRLGGQPDWIEAPTWPVSPELEAPMRFVGQIPLTEQLFRERLSGKTAFLFVSEGETSDGRHVCGGLGGDGESATVVQPGIAVSCDWAPRVVGPRLEAPDPNGAQVDGRLIDRVQPVLTPLLALGSDPDHVPEDEMMGWDAPDAAQGAWPEARQEESYRRVSGDKIGGTPAFQQGDQLPPWEDWLLLLQLESSPHELLNFGDAGAGYFFLSAEGTRSEFIVQSG